MRRLLLIALALAGVTSAQAQIYPSRPITLLAPFAAGGPLDTIGRILADGMRGSLGQAIVIETLPALGAASVSVVWRALPPMATRSASYVAGLLFPRETGTRFTLVPYRGAVPAMQALVAGQTDVMITGPSIALAHIRDGTIKAYAAAARGRSSRRFCARKFHAGSNCARCRGQR